MKLNEDIYTELDAFLLEKGIRVIQDTKGFFVEYSLKGVTINTLTYSWDKVSAYMSAIRIAEELSREKT